MGGTSLVIQQLRLHAFNAGGPGSIPGQGTRSRMPQLRIQHATTKILPAATKAWHSQINKLINIKKKNTMGIFHRTRTNNFKIYMETQKTPNSQNNLEKGQFWKNQAP